LSNTNIRSQRFLLKYARQRPHRRTSAQRQKALLVAIGQRALANGDWQAVAAVSCIIQRRGLAHV
jgi:hypothetical protein